MGYEDIGNSVYYKVRSSLAKTPPTSFLDGPVETAVHVELEADAFATNRFVEVTVSKQVVISALKFKTPKEKALQSFRLLFAEQSVQYPDKWSEQRLMETPDMPVVGSIYRPNLLFGSLRNISAPVGPFEKLRPLYYVHRPFRFQ